MKAFFKTIWPLLALFAGSLLVIFELRVTGGPRGESWIWIGVAGLVVIMSILEIFHRFLGPPKMPG